MTYRSKLNILAVVPYGMQNAMCNLASAATGLLTTCRNSKDLVAMSTEQDFAVAVIPASLPPAEWWSVWGVVSSMDPVPSILVYALQSDFPMWAGVLDSGGYDVLIPPFTKEKLRDSIVSAAAHYMRRKAE